MREPHEPRRDAEALFHRLAEVAHAQLGGEVAPEVDRRSLMTVRARLAEEPLSLADRLFGRRGAARWAFAGAGVAAVAGAAIVFVGGSSLSYTVEGGSVAAGRLQPAPGATEATLHFSDGTDVSVGREAEARVASLTRRGARVTLAEGRAHVRVAKKPRALWMFDAGPFEVTVTGTAFDLQWSSAAGRLDLGMRSGSVRVRGPLAGQGLDLRAGERLIAIPSQGRLEIQRIEDRDQAAAGTPSAPRVEPLSPPDTSAASGVGGASLGEATQTDAPAEGPPPQRASRTGRPTSRAAPEAPVTWARRVSLGEHATVLREAERRGIAEVLRAASSAELAALSDAARYGKRTDLARRALLAQRQRFAGSPRAEDAAFLLGRIAEDVGHDAGLALRWYSTYLDEASSGSYATEAVGRRMILLHKLGSRERACPAAREYLHRQPAGPYAKIARDMCAAAPR